MRWWDKEQAQANEAVFRSAPMTLVQFYVTIEIARDVVYALGQQGLVHFRDLNSKLIPFQRTFVNELRSMDAMEIQFTFLYNMMVKYHTLKGDSFSTLIADKKPLPPTSEIDDIKALLDITYEKLKHLDESYSSLDAKRARLVENRHVLNLVNNFHTRLVDRCQLEDEFGQFEIEDIDDEDEEALLASGRRSLDLQETTADLDEAAMRAITGTIARTKVSILRKILWRTLRGNLYLNDIPIDDPSAAPSNTDLPDKNVFIIYTHGEYLKSRVRRIIQSLDGYIYDNVEGSQSTRQHTMNDLNLKIEDLTSVIESTKSHLVSEIMFFQEKYSDWHYIIKRERLIHEVLNKFDEDSTRRCLVGEGWIPRENLRPIRQTLRTLLREKTQSNRDVLNPDQTINLSTEMLATTPNDLLNNPYFEIGRGDFTDSNSDEEDNEEFLFVAVVNELTTNRVPPTYHKTNKFTYGFQAIVDTYGIATYQEVNPGLATIITFPFMFAIMFGDLGHGFIVLMVALYFIWNERKFGAIRNKDEIFEMAFNGRYIVLLMGIFSMYTGLMYNDIFSKSMTLFSSGWKWEWPKDYDPKSGPISLTAVRIAGKTYPIGLDWIWHGAENGLLFTNSYKMKMSILMGYCHMNYSLILSLVNYRFFRSLVDIVGNFIPGFLFMQSIFGYLALTVVYKWCVDWFGTNRQPPGLLNMLINIFLAPGSIEDPLYSGQKYVQIILVLVALMCVPWLLVYKPFILNRQNKRAMELGFESLNMRHKHNAQMYEEELAFEQLLREQNAEDNRSDDDLRDEGHDLNMLSQTFTFPNDVEPMNLSSGHGHGEEFNLMDIVIHQMIHTIEFCLNCVSHTASYLRLWALSLAHAQLSSVLWTMTIQNAFGTTGYKGIIITVCLFFMWFTLTVCILVLMEGTSAMLHSLRLHWVEAMSKFFIGEGYAYDPFNFDKIHY
ncbi:V0/A0 complex, 116-kDa subunit of ATPase [Metschnikowia bicuspidata]|uniref:V-type proton ATPase subunit a n=1 Tax=Metschnikowia bicuspidata TaxID=27322 RepID=A0A4P9ZHY8_9ASCO|nr:V0/A0 complex, 116-kDa subunit of ATPase [Metschnikowia bicuspidata]